MTSERTDTVTREQFLQNLADSGLSTADAIRAWVDRLPPEGAANGAAIARSLVGANQLTDFQAEAILKRKFDLMRMGNYEVMSRLGSGGMGTVFKARHRRMNRVVAIKVLSSDVAASEAFTQRFQREIETVAKLSHPNIVMAFDADDSPAGHYLVMEFVNGRDLASEVYRGGPLSVADAVDCTLQAARGLAYAHGMNIVHRDVKPANILRREDGVVKVADLGLARLCSPSATGTTSLTQAGGVVGTIDYIAPEQALDSSTIDHRVDVYSLGCTLYFLLTGRPPYTGASVMSVLLKHREAAPPSLSEARADAPIELGAVFHRMVAKSRDDRFATMADVVQVLERIQQRSPLSDVRLGRQPHDATIVHMPGAAGTHLIGPPRQVGVKDTRHAESEADTSAEQLDQRQARPVVLVEPSRTQAGIIRRYLQELGVVRVLAAESGQEALALAKRERAGAILCALHLSDMTGIQLAERLLADADCAKVGLVLATSESDMADIGSLPDSPRTTIMHKPFDPTRLSQALAKVGAK